MGSSFVVMFLACLLAIAAAKPSHTVCTNGQRWGMCAMPSACQLTCDNQIQLCGAPCSEGCACPPQKPLMHNGRCISADKCPSEDCTGGQVWSECGMPLDSVCQLTCEPQTVMCMLVCTPGCACPQDKPVMHEGQCIAADQCPAVCTGGQVWNNCAKPESCQQTCYPPTLQLCLAVCTQRCACPDDKPVLHDGVCIKAQQCPVCSGGQVWSECGMPSECQLTCEPQIMMCKLMCIPGCACPQDKPAMHDGQCIAADQCPAVCPDGQELGCALPAYCQATCGEPLIMCMAPCELGCACPADKPLMSVDGRCISQDECPLQVDLIDK